MSVEIRLHTLPFIGRPDPDDARMFMNDNLNGRWWGYQKGIHDPNIYDARGMFKEFMEACAVEDKELSHSLIQRYESYRPPDNPNSDELFLLMGSHRVGDYLLWDTYKGPIPDWVYDILDDVGEDLPIITYHIMGKIMAIHHDHRLRKWLKKNMGKRIFTVSW